MRKLKINYYCINISLAIILFTLSCVNPENDMNIFGKIFAAAIFIYGIIGLFFALFVRECMICSKKFISAKYEICDYCHSKFQQKIKSGGGYRSMEYPYSSRESFSELKSNSPSRNSSPVSRFIE